LLREPKGNVALGFANTDDNDAMEVAGLRRGQLGLLIETMRREGSSYGSRPRRRAEKG